MTFDLFLGSRDSEDRRKVLLHELLPRSVVKLCLRGILDRECAVVERELCTMLSCKTQFPSLESIELCFL